MDDSVIKIVAAIYLNILITILFLMTSISLQIVALPSRMIFSTQSMLSELLEKWAEKEESAVAKDIPISAYLIAGESFEPSPVIDTLTPEFYKVLTIKVFCAGLIRAKTLAFRTIFLYKIKSKPSYSFPVV